MQTKDKKGIICDTCGLVAKDKFTYYNVVQVHKIGVNIGSNTDVDKRYLDLDICENCWSEILKKVKKVIAKREGLPDEWTTKQ